MAAGTTRYNDINTDAYDIVADGKTYVSIQVKRGTVRMFVGASLPAADVMTFQQLQQNLNHPHIITGLTTGDKVYLRSDVEEKAEAVVITN